MEPVNDGEVVGVEVVHPMFTWLTASRRAWLYRVAGSVAVLASTYGVVDDSKAALFVGLAASLLGVGTATAHTPRAG